MAKSLYLASVEPLSVKSAVALGLLEALKAGFSSVGVFRPVTANRGNRDFVLELLLARSGSDKGYEDCIGVSYQDVHDDPEAAVSEIVKKYRNFEKDFDVVLVLGSDFTDVLNPAELSFNARVATNIQAPMVLTLNGRTSRNSNEHLGQMDPRSATDIQKIFELAMEDVSSEHAKLIAVVINRADSIDGIESALNNHTDVPVWVIPELPGLVAPRVKQILDAVDGELLFGSEARLEGEAVDVIVAAMTEIHVLTRLKDNAMVVVPGDRTDVILPLIMADQATNFPNLAGLVLNGGFELPETIMKLIEGLSPTLPVIFSGGGSYETTMQIVRTRGMLSSSDPDKVNRALTHFQKHVDGEKIVELVKQTELHAVTPLLFEHMLLERAQSNKKTIVLPEGEDDRILLAADEVLRKGIADLIILGTPEVVTAQAKALGLELAGAKIWEIESSPHFENCVREYVRLRADKGVTEALARERMLKSSYFGTMLVQLGLADGMVSGAIHTTADTIRPAFEFVKTKPGVTSVSSVFLMLLDDHVLVYGDCAVIPEPTVEQLADIAISSAETARAFNVEPHVAMLSYSTGASGEGAEVERVRAATELARLREPTLPIEGPIQYDAAVDAAVAAAKLPESEVAGRATVFVFPDLNTGNNTYKAVQRTAGALAIGPILQGLKKPVNDLSRGALVKDIVNTIAVTAVQAGELKDEQ
jgi:phosphate acetyltransferase